MTTRYKSRSRKAGILFPVSKIHQRCKSGPWVGSRISELAPVYFAAVLEYVAAEVLEQAGIVAKLSRKNRAPVILPRHIRVAVSKDKELDILCDGVVMRGVSSIEKEEMVKYHEADLSGDIFLTDYSTSSMKTSKGSRIKRKETPDLRQNDVNRKKSSDVTIDLTGSFNQDISDDEIEVVDESTEGKGDSMVDLTGSSPEESEVGDRNRNLKTSNQHKVNELGYNQMKTKARSDKYGEPSNRFREEVEKGGGKRNNVQRNKEKVGSIRSQEKMSNDLTTSCSQIPNVKVSSHAFERELANMDEHFMKDVRKEKEYNVTKTARQDKVTGKERTKHKNRGNDKGKTRGSIDSGKNVKNIAEDKENNNKGEGFSKEVPKSAKDNSSYEDNLNKSSFKNLDKASIELSDEEIDDLLEFRDLCRGLR